MTLIPLLCDELLYVPACRAPRPPALSTPRSSLSEGSADPGEIGRRPWTHLGGGHSGTQDETAIGETGVTPSATLCCVASAPLSIRLAQPTIERISGRAERLHLAPRTLIQRYVEEGLRMDAHPLIRFSDGPAGRRARLIGGPDVSEVIQVAKDNGGDLAETSAYLDLPLGLVQAATAYYASYPEEIDARMQRSRREREDAHSTFLATKEALAG